MDDTDIEHAGWVGVGLLVSLLDLCNEFCVSIWRTDLQLFTANLVAEHQQGRWQKN
jgi:hypothetical protein